MTFNLAKLDFDESSHTETETKTKTTTKLKNSACTLKLAQVVGVNERGRGSKRVKGARPGQV